ncbi:hypothetical protein CC1G_00503 [Coprinopsis cinerea okayama7|uniref:Uncharacterized protein n=1 Tax=Coprinopsis cinerea (strain Okayama-7 / 130 / ATCC MYA-4618 / FGSC 9003) TaxID=240176 RepID=A8N379_COPC7|nr:hypothetical protein CC1G_00503 [Coprinopsis cinerea okayama7\|eukprot:XP_001829324.2 hypothetical protein CC1G_00503 [Coprinopsis cinerea okayama7\
MFYSKLPVGRVYEPSSFITSPDINNSPTSAVVSEPLSIQTDVVAGSSRYVNAMANDVPDLYFETGYSTTPPSAASSSMIPTPLYDWDTPLPQSSPHSMAPSKSSPSFDPWTLSNYDAYQPYSSYSPEDRHRSSPHCPQESSVADWLDELDWEKQRYQPEFSPPANLNYPHGHGDHYGGVASSSSSSKQPPSLSFQQHNSSYTPSAIHDTQHKQFGQAASSSASSSSISSAFNNTVSPSMLSLSNTNTHMPSTSVLSSTPPTNAQPQVPIKLHQPRPSRRIPIISPSCTTPQSTSPGIVALATRLSWVCPTCTSRPSFDTETLSSPIPSTEPDGEPNNGF